MEPQVHNHMDNIFRVMGELKIFTVLQFLIVHIVSFPAACQLLANVFISMDNPHQCAAGPSNSTKILSGLDEYKDENLTVSYQQCEILVSFNHTVLKREKCIYGMDYDLPVHSSAVSQFDLVCEYSSLAKLTQTLVIVGQGIGAAFFTMLSDRLGRKPILIVCNFGLGMCGLIIAYAPIYPVFAIFKFFLGTFQQGCIAVSITHSIEILTTKNRRIAVLLHGLSFSLAAMFLALCAYLLRNHSWRTLQMVLSLMSITFILQIWLMKESLRWLIANGKEMAATVFIQTATKWNKTSYERSIVAYRKACHLQTEDKHQDPSAKGTATKRLTLLDLLKVKRLLVNAVIIWIAWFTATISYFAIYLTSATLAGNAYLNFFLISLMEASGYTALYFIINKFGRKLSLATTFTTVSIGLIGGGLFLSLEKTSFSSAMTVVFYCIGMLGAGASFEVCFFYTPEIFPTNIRNQALGISSLVGRVGGMIAPFTGVLSEKAKWAPGVMIGCLSLVLCLLSVFLPETKGKELPQTIEDVKMWFSKSNKEKEDSDSKDDEEGDKLHDFRGENVQ